MERKEKKKREKKNDDEDDEGDRNEDRSMNKLKPDFMQKTTLSNTQPIYPPTIHLNTTTLDTNLSMRSKRQTYSSNKPNTPPPRSNLSSDGSGKSG